VILEEEELLLSLRINDDLIIISYRLFYHGTLAEDTVGLILMMILSNKKIAGDQIRLNVRSIGRTNQLSNSTVKILENAKHFSAHFYNLIIQSYV
jgi:hypothetical protein